MTTSRRSALKALLAAPADSQTARPGGEQRTERIAAELVPMTQWATPGSTWPHCRPGRRMSQAGGPP